MHRIREENTYKISNLKINLLIGLYASISSSFQMNVTNITLQIPANRADNETKDIVIPFVEIQELLFYVPSNSNPVIMVKVTSNLCKHVKQILDLANSSYNIKYFDVDSSGMFCYML